MILLLVVLIFSVITRVRAVEEPTYKICKQQQTECKIVSYRVGDASKGRLCREACGKQRGELKKKWNAYHCEGRDEICNAYDVYGRNEFDTAFDRHVMCVQMCHFVAKVQHNSENALKLCSEDKQDCIEIKRVGGTFDAFNRCAFKCDGWPMLKNTDMHKISVCCSCDKCQEGSYFTEPNKENPFVDLKGCFNSCLAGKRF
nr:unnamed protein product [Spirometra erinaceieuropaei]